MFVYIKVKSTHRLIILQHQLQGPEMPKGTLDTGGTGAGTLHRCSVGVP